MSGWRGRAAAVALFSAALASCGGGNDYPQEAEQAFMSNCTAQPSATETYCGCVLDELQESMSFEEFKRVDAAIRVGGVGAIPDDSRQKFIDAVANCEG